MTMENDLVERLLEPVTLSGMQSSIEVYQRVIVQRSEAADRIQALEADLASARNDALEEAAKIVANYDLPSDDSAPDDYRDGYEAGTNEFSVFASQAIRAARAALTEQS